MADIGKESIMYELEKQYNECLTQRELEVMSYVKLCMSNEEISEKMNISISTVKAHISSVLLKLKAKNRMQAVMILAQNYEKSDL